ncbi:hypothetical protein QAD02_009546 [Eretmocerus hayati]|uniref:Uncharacterized protein n=1 Tax=Eretmocerus hayati TaxID=131215 RepID=A0ACC2N9S0_9HYME|nr:hypothetical protein QAD02_009546 [Eretmocerus hayati]
MKLLSILVICTTYQYVSSIQTTPLPVAGPSNNEREQNADCVDDKTISCRICNTLHKNKKSLTHHFRDCHPGEQPYMCQFCDRGFPHLSSLETHTRTHTDEKPFSCNICGNSFKEKGKLQRHIKTHDNAKPFICTICGAGFKDNCNLLRHNIIHSDNKPFRCHICHQRFTQSNNLKLHIRIHTGERPYACNLCNSRFSDASSLRKHKKSHEENKPYICEICGKKFGTEFQYNEHVRSHSNEKTFCCGICGEKFKLCTELNKHVGTHLRGNSENKQPHEPRRSSPHCNEMMTNTADKTRVELDSMREYHSEANTDPQWTDSLYHNQMHQQNQISYGGTQYEPTGDPLMTDSGNEFLASNPQTADYQCEEIYPVDDAACFCLPNCGGTQENPCVAEEFSIPNDEMMRANHGSVNVPNETRMLIENQWEPLDPVNEETSIHGAVGVGEDELGAVGPDVETNYESHRSSDAALFEPETFRRMGRVMIESWGTYQCYQYQDDDSTDEMRGIIDAMITSNRRRNLDPDGWDLNDYGSLE